MKAILCLLLMSVSALSQEQAPYRVPLRILDAREVSQVTAAVIRYPIKCGDGGSLYFRTYLQNEDVPIIRLSGDGKDRKDIGLKGTSYAGKARIVDFAPLRRGGVALLVFYRPAKVANGEYRLLDFADDGTMRHDVRLHLSFDPRELAMFDNGEALIAGRKPTAEGGGTGDPVLAIVDDRGQLLRTLSITGDLRPEQVTDWPKDTMSPRGLTHAEQYEVAIDLSIAESGDDGNVYLLRRGPRGPLFQITPSGTVRTINLPLLPSAMLMTLKVSAGDLLVQYAQRLSDSNTYLYRVFEPSTMTLKGEYTDAGPAYLGSALGCYTPDGLTFVTRATNQNLKIVTARP